MNAEQILNFWFQELKPQQWFMKDEKLDQEMRKRFLDIHTQAAKGELFHWRKNPEGRLAEIIILDQFSRNIYRGTTLSFATDALALVLAQEAIQHGYDQKLEISKRAFLYMPYMHSESLKIHEEAVKLFQQKGLEGNYDFELKHKHIIERFGRYPHRNEILERKSTAEELEFLAGPNSSF